MKIVSIQHSAGDLPERKMKWDNYIVHGVTDRTEQYTADCKKIDWDSIIGDAITETFKFSKANFDQMLSDLRIDSPEKLKGKKVTKVLHDSYGHPVFMIVV